MGIPSIKQLLEQEKYREIISIMQDKGDDPTREELIALAISLIKIKDFINTEPILKTLYYNDTDNPTITLLMALCYESLKDKKKAAYFYKKCTRYKATRDSAKEALDNLNYSEDTDEETEKIRELKPFKSDISFKDVMGLKRQKEYMQTHIVKVIKQPELFKKYGKRLGNAVLLYGPPGTGKSYLAKAIAGETMAYMLIGKINELIGEYMGVTEKNLSKIFEIARMHSPCIIFFDEIDALGGKRSSFGGSDVHGGTGALKIAVNQFLTEMSGIESNPEGLFVIGATNSPWSMDSALKRSGRFSDTIYIGAPNYTDRIESFKYHMSNKKYERLHWGRLARATIDYSQADIDTICDDAARSAALRDKADGNMYILTMKDMLSHISEKKNSLAEWYIQTSKEIIGHKETSKINGKKQVTEVKGSLEPEELELYSDLIRDIRKQTSPMAQIHKKMQRFVALRLL